MKFVFSLCRKTVSVYPLVFPVARDNGRAYWSSCFQRNLFYFPTYCGVSSFFFPRYLKMRSTYRLNLGSLSQRFFFFLESFFTLRHPPMSLPECSVQIYFPFSEQYPLRPDFPLTFCRAVFLVEAMWSVVCWRCFQFLWHGSKAKLSLARQLFFFFMSRSRFPFPIRWRLTSLLTQSPLPVFLL